MKRIVVALFIACSASIAAQDAGNTSDAFYAAIRANDLAALQTLLKSGANPNAADPRGGATPLMNAAVIGSVEAMKLLLDHGADPNAKNTNGATALIWAAGDLERVRLLLARGADAKAVSQRGRTALYVAARSDASAPTVKMLIASGADPNATDSLKATVLHAAVLGNDTATIRFLLEAGADVNAVDFGGFTPLIHAASNGNLEVAKLLLAKGANINARSNDGSFQKVKAGTIALGQWTPLSAAAACGPTALIKTLLDAGADVNVRDVRGMTPLTLAVSTDRQNPDVVQLLLAKGADVNVKSLAGETALDWARKIGSPRIIAMLKNAGGSEMPHQVLVLPAPAHADVKTSVQRSLSLLTKMSIVAAANGGCASCHSHNVVDLAEGVARAKGLAVDQKLIAQRQTLTKAPYFSLTTVFERFDRPVPELDAYALIALHSSGYAPDRTTDGVAVSLMAQQRADGHWSSGTVARPPIEDGDIFRTAVGIRAIALYAPPARAAEAKTRIARARTWLSEAKAMTAEDRNMQLLGLHWAGAEADDRARLARAIVAKQRGDGGWSQTDNLSSDAYATGQSLFALTEGGGVKIDSAAYRKGVTFLLSTQRPDGSWYVSSRSPKFQPFFDGGFPYGHDQWISSMATGWATAALAAALPSPQSMVQRR
jgi:ankyrin repeat protein